MLQASFHVTMVVLISISYSRAMNQRSEYEQQAVVHWSLRFVTGLLFGDRHDSPVSGEVEEAPPES
jgi:hypothetical protein